MTEEMFFEWVRYMFVAMGGALLLLIICMGLVTIFHALWRWARGY